MSGQNKQLNAKMKKTSLSVLGFFRGRHWKPEGVAHTIYDFQWDAIVAFLSTSFSACLEAGDKIKIQILFVDIIFYFVGTHLFPLLPFLPII